MTQHLYLSQVRTVLPNLAIEKVEQSNGQFSDVMIINHEWIFRFPRYREGVARLHAEERLLEVLKGQLPLPIPAPTHRSFDPPVPGLAFLSYRRLPGEALLPETLDQIRDDILRDSMARLLAAFMRALHAVSLVDLPADLPGAPAEGGICEQRAGWVNFYQSARKQLFAAMRPEARRTVIRHFEAYLDDSSLHEFTPCLRHGDLGGSNILWDGQSGAITGVIDFADCAIGDPAYDLASLSTLGADFFERLSQRYDPDPINRALLLARARFYRGTFALSEALEGLRTGNRDAYQRGMEAYV
jgi:aminoglycoside 2''-phosphotransferase